MQTIDLMLYKRQIENSKKQKYKHEVSVSLYINVSY